MHVIIVGGGEIGFSLAKALAAGHDVFVIDHAPAVADRFEALDVQFLLGTGTSADVLKRAGIEHAGILVACTGLDEVNIVTCAIGNRLGSPRTFCFVSHEDFVEFQERQPGRQRRTHPPHRQHGDRRRDMARRGSLRGGAVRLGRASAHRRAVRIDVRVATTGATAIGDFGAFGRGVFLWRAMTHWIGRSGCHRALRRRAPPSRDRRARAVLRGGCRPDRREAHTPASPDCARLGPKVVRHTC